MAKIISKDSDRNSVVPFFAGVLLIVSGAVFEMADKVGALDQNLISTFNLHKAANLYSRFGTFTAYTPEWFKNVDSISTALIFSGLLIMAIHTKYIEIKRR